MPTWANSANASSWNKPIESWHASLPKLPPSPTAVFASAHALSELDLLHEPLAAAAQTAGEHVQKLEPSGAFSCSEIRHASVQNETTQVTNVGDGDTLLFTLSSPALRQKSRVESFGKTREGDMHTYDFEDDPVIATKRNFTTSTAAIVS